jgi:hypothetical protein
MIRLRLKVKENEIKPVLNRIQNLGCKKWIGYGYSSYKYNFVVDGTFNGITYSYYIGYWQNSEIRSIKHGLVIEYNPNKVPENDGVLEYIFKNMLRRDTEVLSVDIAVDIMNVNIQYVVVDKKSKHLKMTYDKGGDDKTYYEDENYCPKCGTKLIYKSNYSSYEPELPEGYVYDFYGHQRRDPDYERRRQEELRESYRNRW